MSEGLIHSEPSLNSRAKVLRRGAGPAVALAACALLLVFLHGLSRALDYHSVMLSLRETPRELIWMTVLLTVVSYIALAACELSALSYVGVKVSMPALLLASFCGSALGNAISFKTLTTDAVRDRVYGALGVRPEQTARVMLFIHVAFGVGLGVFMAAALALSGSGSGRLLPVSSIVIRSAGAVALLVILPTLLLSAWKRKAMTIGRLRIGMPSLAITLLQLLASAADLAAAAAALWLLLPSGEIDFFSFAVVFSAATALGAVSRIPGGLGVFDVIVFVALRRFVPANELAAALLIYRGVYFVLPLLLATATLAGLELRSAPGRFGSKAGERIALGAGLLAPIFLSAVTFTVGAMLVVSGATPAMDWRLAVLQGVLPLWAVEISHLLATLAGVFLLFVARGLYHRLDGAWWLALIAALVNVAFCLAKGLAFGETAAVVFLVCLLLATRREFTRPAAFMHQPFRWGWFIAIAVVIACAIGILFFAFHDVTYRREIWWQFEFDAKASRSLRAILAASIFALGISLWQLLRASPGRVEPPSDEDLARAAAIICGQDRSAPTLALMGDKSFLFSSSGNSFLMYAKRGRSWVALFDPVGPHEEWPELVWRFVELADRHGGRAAFYQVRPDSLPLYLDAGLRVVKVGEEACIYLDQFSLEGSERYGLRQALKRGERDGLSFQILPPQRSGQDQDVICQISERWLSNHHAAERGFSVAAYEPRFISAQSVALLCQNGEPLAFVTFMTTNCRTEATVGLMRQVPGAPPYTMDLIFTQLALQLRARAFKVLSLGMAPLAGMARTPLSSRWHRIAGLVWEHGRPIYNFRGLRGFKNKFHPVWEPRYLAVSGAAGPFITLADVAALASGYRGPSST
ncbi:MAG: bifunctional lysylphosphatidylglycerol flippase/synthetase MprF [Candidatus Binataceae bacterium]